MGQAVTTLAVRIDDVRGAVVVRSGQVTYRGVIETPPEKLVVGNTLELVIEAADQVPPERARVTGRIESVGSMTGGATIAPIYAGLNLRLELLRWDPLAEPIDVEKTALRMPPPRMSQVVGAFAPDELADLDDTVLSAPSFLSEPDVAPFAQVAATGESMPREPTGVVGTLRQMSVPEVLQGLDLGRRTALIDVRAESDGTRGGLYVDAGRLVAAHFGPLRGDEAFFAMAHLDAGTYRVRFGRTADAHNIDKPTAFLILEAMRRKDEQQQGEVTAPRGDGPEDLSVPQVSSEEPVLHQMDALAESAAREALPDEAAMVDAIDEVFHDDSPAIREARGAASAEAAAVGASDASPSIDPEVTVPEREHPRRTSDIQTAPSTPPASVGGLRGEGTARRRAQRRKRAARPAQAAAQKTRSARSASPRQPTTKKGGPGIFGGFFEEAAETPGPSDDDDPGSGDAATRAGDGRLGNSQGAMPVMVGAPPCDPSSVSGEHPSTPPS